MTHHHRHMTRHRRRRNTWRRKTENCTKLKTTCSPVRQDRDTGLDSTPVAAPGGCSPESRLTGSSHHYRPHPVPSELRWSLQPLIGGELLRGAGPSLGEMIWVWSQCFRLKLKVWCCVQGKQGQTETLVPRCPNAARAQKNKTKTKKMKEWSRSLLCPVSGVQTVSHVTDQLLIRYRLRYWSEEGNR